MGKTMQEALLALFVEQMDMLRDDYVKYEKGDAKVPFAVVRDATVAALNAYDEVRDTLATAAPVVDQDRRDAERYRWLRDSDACSLSISHNDHHNMYLSVADTLDDSQGYYREVNGEERKKMIATDTIWTLHIYPDTPVGFNVYHAASLDAAIDEAMALTPAAGAPKDE